MAGAGWLFFVGAWLVILMGFLGIVALVGFHDTLRLAGPVMILAPILVPAYLAADPAGQAMLG